MAEFITLNGYSVKDTKARQILKNKLHHYNDINDLTSQTDLVSGAVIQTMGYKSADDGGAALYIIRERSDSDIEDKGLIHFINDDLVAEMVITDKINVKQFGALGDSKTNDTKAIQNAIDTSVVKGAPVYLPHGAYVVDGIKLPMFVHFYGDGHDSVLIGNSTDNVITVVYNPDKDDKYLTGQKNHLHDFRINGNREKVSAITDSMHEELGNGIFIKHVYSATFTPSAHDMEVYINNVWIHGCVGNGVFIGPTARSVHLSNMVISYNSKNGVFVFGTDNFLRNIISHNNEFNGIFIANENNFLSDSKCFRNSHRTKDYSDILAGGFSNYGEIVVDFYVDQYPYIGSWSMRGANLSNVQAQEGFGNGFIFKHVDSLQATNIVADGINFSDEWDSANPKLSDLQGSMPKRNAALLLEKCFESKIDFTFGNFLFYPPDVLEKILKINGPCHNSTIDIKTSRHFHWDAYVNANSDGSQRFTTIDEWNIENWLAMEGACCQITVNNTNFTYNKFFHVYGISDSSFTSGDVQATMRELYNAIPRYCEFRLQCTNGSIDNVSFSNFCSALPETDGELFVQKLSNRIIFTWFNCTYDNKKHATYHDGLTTKFIGWN